jgi:dihydrofolate reductase
MKITVFIATSLDGFIARENGEVDWLSGPEIDDIGDDYGFQQFMESIDTIVMGRNTFDFIAASGQWFYGDKTFIILTSREIQIPANFPQTIETFNGSPSELIDLLNKKGAKHIYLDGGKTIQDFLNAGLVQQIIITRIPILLGKGIPLFGTVPNDIKLKHIETKSYVNGIVQSRYEIR